MVAIAIKPYATSMGTQRIAFVTAILLEQIVTTENLCLPELQRRIVLLTFLVQQRVRKDNLVEEVPCTIIAQRTCSAGMDIPEGVEQTTGLHIVKRALGTSKPLVVIPAAFMGGAVFCMVSDLIARMAFSPTELNISTVTSVLGAPVVIFMLIRRRR